MAKQAGIHGLRGKVNGMSYYYSKNGGELTRKINEGIGERVKSSAAYVNTRKNNAEFGAAGAMAGAIMRTIPQKYRYILQSTATGLLNKEIKKLMSLDPDNLWGQRSFISPAQETLLSFFNTLSKNKFPESLAFAIKTNMKDDGTAKIVFSENSVQISNEYLEELRSIGATHVSILHYAMNVDTPYFDTNTGEYIQPVGQIEYLQNISLPEVEVKGNAVILADESSPVNINLFNDDPTVTAGLFTVVLPIRRVGLGYNVLQEHCSAAWQSISSGTVPEP